MLTITASFKGAPEYDVGYFEFFRLRTEVAHTISEEFGEHYAGMIRELYRFACSGRRGRIGEVHVILLAGHQPATDHQ